MSGRFISDAREAIRLRRRGYMGCATPTSRCGWFGTVFGLAGCTIMFIALGISSSQIVDRLNTCAKACDAQLVACADKLDCECYCGADAGESNDSASLSDSQCDELKGIMYSEPIARDSKIHFRPARTSERGRRLDHDDDDEDDDDDDDDDEDEDEDEYDGQHHHDDHDEHGAELKVREKEFKAKLAKAFDTATSRCAKRLTDKQFCPNEQQQVGADGNSTMVTSYDVDSDAATIRVPGNESCVDKHESCRRTIDSCVNPSRVIAAAWIGSLGALCFIVGTFSLLYLCCCSPSPDERPPRYQTAAPATIREHAIMPGESTNGKFAERDATPSAPPKYYAIGIPASGGAPVVATATEVTPVGSAQPVVAEGAPHPRLEGSTTRDRGPPQYTPVIVHA
jgi:hypothetical protein